MPAVPAILAVFFLLLSANTAAVTTITVVDIPTRGVNQRILYLRPDAPTANLIILPGGSGFLNIQNNLVVMCSPV